MLYTPPGRFSGKDFVGHLAAWEAELVQTLHAVAQGQPGSLWSISDFDAFNQEQARRRAHLTLAEQVAELHSVRANLIAALQQLPDAVLEQPRISRTLAYMPLHDAEHLPSFQERFAAARGDLRRAAVHRLEYTRAEILAGLERLPLEALEERLPEKWSIKEILLHLGSRDELCAEALLALAHDRPLPSELRPPDKQQLDESNAAHVAARAHYTPYRALHYFAEMRGRFVGALLSLPDAIWQREEVQAWIDRRKQHDAHHSRDIGQRRSNWLRRQK